MSNLNPGGLTRVLNYVKTWVTGLLNDKANSSHSHTTSQITDFPSLSTVATSGSYNDLSNKPTIPTVNNSTLTIKVNGTTAGTFTANQATNEEIDITTGDTITYATNTEIDALTAEWHV